MNVRRMNHSPLFTSRIIETMSMKRTSEYAAKNNLLTEIEETKKFIKNKGNLKLRITQNYSKALKESKVQIAYEKLGQKCLEVITDSKITEPAELAMKVLADLRDPASKLFKKIF